MKSGLAPSPTLRTQARARYKFAKSSESRGREGLKSVRKPARDRAVLEQSYSQLPGAVNCTEQTVVRPVKGKGGVLVGFGG